MLCDLSGGILFQKSTKENKDVDDDHGHLSCLSGRELPDRVRGCTAQSKFVLSEWFLLRGLSHALLGSNGVQK